MHPREQPQETMNMTRALEALSPYLNHPRKTVSRIEAFVAVAAALLFVQLILGPWRRRSGHWFVQGTLWLAYTLSFPLITYTLGQMVSSPVKNALYPIWATILFWAAGCTNGITAYSLDDNKQWKRYLFEFLQNLVYFWLTIALLMPSESRTFLLFLTLYLLGGMLCNTNMIRIIAGRMVTNSIPSKLIADYMRGQVGARGAQEPSDPSTMEGYKYLVRPACRKRGQEDITTKEIWDIDDSLLNTPGGGSQLKYICLSFALSLLLRRRFFEMDCAEAGLAETRKFALEVLLSEENPVNHYSKPFHIIEVELGFLYDFFFTKYAALYHGEGGRFLSSVVLKLISTSVAGAFLLRCSPIIITINPVIEVGTTRVDVTVTIVIMGALLLFEALQAILYVTSDWATVSLACSYSRRGTWTTIPSVIWFLRRFKLSIYWISMMARHKFGKFSVASSNKMFGKILDKLNLFGYWQNKMGQSSLIEGCLHVNMFYVSLLTINSGITFDALYNYIAGLIHSMVFSKKKFEVVSDLVKSEIVSWLRKYSKGGPLTNGEAALRRNLVFEEFSWTLENNSQTVVMLIWHIATEYCNIASSDESEVHQSGSPEEEKLQKDNNQQVATTLSKYCAYLMSFVPELLPGNSTDTRFLFNDVLLEGRRKLCKGKLSRDGLLKVINNSESSSSTSNEDHTIVHDSEGYDNNNTTAHISSSRNNEDTIIDDSSGSNNDHTNAQDSTTNNNECIFIKGLKLGRELEQKGDVLCWKVLAEFWVETIIYIAPSDKVEVHMERLAQGGEFLTHVWALLTHAGILKRNQKQTPEDMV